MRSLVCLVLAFGLMGCNYSKLKNKFSDLSHEAKEKNMSQILLSELTTLDDKKIKLSDFSESKVFLVVNTASECGFTSQYKGLEALHKKYKDKGLVVLGFPSNDFGAQEPGSNEKIKEFCELNYGVSFPLMSKAPVSGDKKQDFYKLLIAQSGDPTEVSWNFEKFMMTKSDGKVERFKSSVTPEELDKKLSKIL